VLALVHLVVRHGVLPQLVAAQMRFELCAGLWAARMASSASGVMRGIVPAWLRRGSVDDTPTAVGKGWNAFRIEGRHFSTRTRTRSANARWMARDGASFVQQLQKIVAEAVEGDLAERSALSDRLRRR